jgi:lipid-binding SYLF domain-containing protein
MGGASIGFQAGMQDAQVMLLIMTDRGLRAIMDNQFKLGADAIATFIDLGGGIEGATTAALSADIVGFTRARGLYAGISLSGSLLASKSDWNQAYYGRPMAAQQIVINMEATNPAADPLRQILIRYGQQSETVVAPALPAPIPLQQGAQLQPIPLQPGPRPAPVQQQPLTAPRR